MDCKKADEMMSLYVSGDLEKAEKTRLEGHLSECPECLEKINLLRRDRDRISMLAQPEKPMAGSDFFEGVLSKIASDRVRDSRSMKAWMGLAAAAAVILFLGVGAFAIFQPPQSEVNSFLGERPADIIIDDDYFRTIDARQRLIEFTRYYEAPDETAPQDIETLDF